MRSSDQIRVLVVEDDPLTANLIRAALTSASCRIELTHDGETAVALWRATRHHLLILDLRLLGEMDGIDVYQEVRRIAGAPPRAIVISAATEAPALARALGLPIIVKPFAVKDLRAVVATALGQPVPGQKGQQTFRPSTSAHRR